jgi:hypothetical protein
MENKRLTEKQTIELMMHSATNCLLQLYTQVFLDYIGGI